MSSSKHQHDHDEADPSHSPVKTPDESTLHSSSRSLPDVQLSERACSPRVIAPPDASDPLKVDVGSADASWPSGYYYQDSEGNTEGPCSLQDLQALQSHFQEASQMMIWVSDGSGSGYSGQLGQILYWAAAQQQSSTQQEQTLPAPASVTATTPVSKPAPTSGMPSANAYAEAVLAGAWTSWEFPQACSLNICRSVTMSMCTLSCLTCLSPPAIPVQSNVASRLARG